MLSVGTDHLFGETGYAQCFGGTCAAGAAAEPRPDATKEKRSEDTVSLSTEAKSRSGQELSQEEQKQVAELKKRDQEVRAHEAAHMGAGGGVVRGGATYTYQAGPDGGRYAIGGEVGIDASPVKDNPEATIRKMQQVRAAALAPAKPSGQDRSVAAAAAAQEASARMQLREENMQEREENKPETAGAPAGRKETVGYTSKGDGIAQPVDVSSQIDVAG